MHFLNSIPEAKMIVLFCVFGITLLYTQVSGFQSQRGSAISASLFPEPSQRVYNSRQTQQAFLQIVAPTTQNLASSQHSVNEQKQSQTSSSTSTSSSSSSLASSSTGRGGNQGEIYVHRQMKFRSFVACQDEHPPHIPRHKYPNYCHDISTHIQVTGDASICYANPGAALCWCRQACGTCNGFLCKDSTHVNCANLKHLCDRPEYWKFKCLCPVTCGSNCEDLSSYCCGNQLAMGKAEF